MIQNLSKIANTVKPETGLFPVVKGEKGLGVDTALHVMHSLHLRWLQWLIVMSTIGHTHTLIFSSANFNSRKEDFLAKSVLEWNGKASQKLWIASLMSLFIERWQIMSILLFSSVRNLMSRCWISLCYLNVFMFATIFAFVFVFMLALSCLIIILIKCTKGHKSLGSLFVLKMYLSLSLI